MCVMATVVAPELKNELMSRGIWADFIRRREDVKAERGCSTRECSIAALNELAPDLVFQMKPRGRPLGPPKSKKPPEEVPPKNAAGEPAPELGDAHKPTLADAKRAAKDRRMGGASEVPAVTRETFSGKSCSNMQSLIWAVESLAFADVRPEDAPSALAWSIYSLMVSSPSSKADIVKVTAAKIAQKASVEEENGGGFDGEGEYSMLDAIAKEADE